MPDIIPPTVVVLIDSGLNQALISGSVNTASLVSTGVAQSVLVSSGITQAEITE